MFFPLRCSDMIDRGHYDQRTLNSRRENQGEWVTVSCVNHWQSQMERERGAGDEGQVQVRRSTRNHLSFMCRRCGGRRNMSVTGFETLSRADRRVFPTSTRLTCGRMCDRYRDTERKRGVIETKQHQTRTTINLYLKGAKPVWMVLQEVGWYQSVLSLWDFAPPSFSRKSRTRVLLQTVTHFHRIPKNQSREERSSGPNEGTQCKSRRTNAPQAGWTPYIGLLRESEGGRQSCIARQGLSETQMGRTIATIEITAAHEFVGISLNFPSCDKRVLNHAAGM